MNVPLEAIDPLSTAVFTEEQLRSALGFEDELGEYFLEEKLGSSPLSEVYLAQRIDGLRVVIKSVPEHLDPEIKWELEDRLRLESEALQSLNDPGIAEFVEYNEIAGQKRLVVAYVEGKDLRQVLKSGEMTTLGTKVELLKKIAAAVAYANQRGVSHRDLKPENVRIRPDGSPVLLDFGSTKRFTQSGLPVNNLTRETKAIGTLGYMAPEQLEGKGALESDWWALGVLAYEVLAGVHPFQPKGGETEAEWLARLHEARAIPLRDIAPKCPKDLAALVEAAMRPNPRDRVSALAFEEDLQRWSRGEMLKVRPLSWPMQLWRLLLAHRLAVGTVLAMVLISMGFVVSAWLREKEALSHSRKAEATSQAYLAAEASVKGKINQSLEFCRKALVLDPTQPMAGWLAAQLTRQQIGLQELDRSNSPPILPMREPIRFKGTHDGLLALAATRDRFIYAQLTSERNSLAVTSLIPDSGWGEILSVDLSPDGRDVLILCADGMARLLEFPSLKERWKYPTPAGQEQSAWFSPKGNIVHLAGGHGVMNQNTTSLILLRREDGSVVFPLEEVSERVLSSSANTSDDGQWLLLTGTMGRKIWAINLADRTRKELGEFWRKIPGSGHVNSVVPIPGTHDFLVYGQSRGYQLLRINAETGKLIWSREMITPGIEYTVNLYDLAFHEKGVFFAAVGISGDARVHRLSDGEPVGGILDGERPYSQIKFLPGNLLLVHESKACSIWNWETSEKLAERAFPASHVTLDQKVIALQPTLNEFRLFEIQPPSLQERIATLGEIQTGFALDAERRRAVLTSLGGHIVPVSLDTFRDLAPARHYGGTTRRSQRKMIPRSCLSGDGHRWAYVKSDREVVVLDISPKETEAKERLFTAPQIVRTLGLNRDGSRLVIIMENGRWQGYEVESGSLLKDNDVLVHPPVVDNAGSAPGTPMSVAVDKSDAFAIGTEQWCTASIFSMATWETIQEPMPYGHSICALDFDSQGRLWTGDYMGLIRCVDRPPYLRDEVNRLFDKEKREIPSVRLSPPVLSLKVSRHGQWVAAARSDWRVDFWSTNTDNLERRLPNLEHSGPVADVDWSPDDSMLLTGSAISGKNLGELTLWDFQTGRPLWRQILPSPVVQVAFNGEGNAIVVARLDGKIMLKQIATVGSQASDLIGAIDDILLNAEK